MLTLPLEESDAAVGEILSGSVRNLKQSPRSLLRRSMKRAGGVPASVQPAGPPPEHRLGGASPLLLVSPPGPSLGPPRAAKDKGDGHGQQCQLRQEPERDEAFLAGCPIGNERDGQVLPRMGQRVGPWLRYLERQDR